MTETSIESETTFEFEPKCGDLAWLVYTWGGKTCIEGVVQSVSLPDFVVLTEYGNPIPCRWDNMHNPKVWLFPDLVKVPMLLRRYADTVNCRVVKNYRVSGYQLLCRYCYGILRYSVVEHHSERLFYDPKRNTFVNGGWSVCQHEVVTECDCPNARHFELPKELVPARGVERVTE